MQKFDIIKKNIISEKSQGLELKWIYTVEVHKNATKSDIKSAFVNLYWVKVSSVNLIKTREKYKNTKTWIVAKRLSTNKALVRLKKWEKIVDFIKLKTK